MALNVADPAGARYDCKVVGSGSMTISDLCGSVLIAMLGIEGSASAWSRLNFGTRPGKMERPTGGSFSAQRFIWPIAGPFSKLSDRLSREERTGPEIRTGYRPCFRPRFHVASPRGSGECALAAAQSRDVLDAGSQIEGIHVSMRVDKMLSAESLFQGEYLFPIFLAVSMGAVHRIVNALPSGMFQAVATRSKTSSFVLIAETKAMPLVAAMTNCPRNEPINARPAPKEIAGISRAPLIA